tara:strand:+ start:178 stop:375 length:198 start_codon:yes stop_codon:yes gene_type:complete
MKRFITAASACCKSDIRQIKICLKGVFNIKANLAKAAKTFFRCYEGASSHYDNWEVKKGRRLLNN